MYNYTRPVGPAPMNISTNGRCAMGTYNSPIQNVNFADIKKPLGYNAPSVWNNFRLKEWQAYQISNDDWFICLAVFNSKSAGMAFVVAFNKHEEKLYQYKQQVPAWKVTVPNGLYGTHCYYHGEQLSIDFKGDLENNLCHIDVKATGFKNLPDLSGNFKAFHTTEPIVIIQPFSDNRPLYSHKALMKTIGSFTFGKTESKFSKDTSCAIVDEHKGYYPYEMDYDWVTTLDVHAEHGLVGFNLTDNQIQDHERYNENCLWLNGKMYPLPPIKVHRPEGLNQTWIIKDRYHRVNLTFTPLADFSMKQNRGIAKVDYKGPTGIFSGYILDAEDNRISFDKFIGMGERNYARV